MTPTGTEPPAGEALTVLRPCGIVGQVVERLVEGEWQPAHVLSAAVLPYAQGLTVAPAWVLLVQPRSRGLESWTLAPGVLARVLDEDEPAAQSAPWSPLSPPGEAGWPRAPAFDTLMALRRLETAPREPRRELPREDEPASSEAPE